jgi:hypothetical protein
LRNSPLYILTEDLSFFYRVNKELKKLKISFKILNLDKIIPHQTNILLTTSKEAALMVDQGNDSIILAYSEEDDFENYIIRVLAALRVGYKDHYSEILFSVDPGKRTGLMIFLEGYYLYSYCCFKPDEILEKIMRYVECFQSDNQNSMNIIFKLGNGVLAITISLVKEIYSTFNEVTNLKILIIDEFKSSKFKLNQKNILHPVSKDEISALILALRDGIEINQKNYLILIKQSYKNRKFNHEEVGFNNNKGINDKSTVAKIILSVIEGDLTLKSASKELKLLNRLK